MSALHDDTVAVRIPAGRVVLEGLLGVPPDAPGIVLFAHGSGSSRLSPRNTFVARALRRAGLATLLFDLLTEAESDAGVLVFDAEFLARRLGAATEWVRTQPATAALPIGYFGASTGTAAALIAAADDPAVAAVVSRGGRPDLAARALPRVEAPTLLIVGGEDTPVIAMNEDAVALMRCETRLVIVPGATHLFEEPGTLEVAARLATAWFREHFAGARTVDATSDVAPDGVALPFRDRREAGRLLAERLRHHAGRADTVVLGLPRGGVVPAVEIASALGLPVDVIVSRKLGAPDQPELAIGAIAEGGAPYLDAETLAATDASPEHVERAVALQRAEIERRRRRFRDGRALPVPRGGTVILVDDGVATGSTAIAAIRALRECGAGRVVFAVPVAPPDTAERLRGMVDELVVLATPEEFWAVGAFYRDFDQVTDDEVVALLARADRPAPAHGEPAAVRRD